MDRVLVVQRRMTHYRVAFFERLRDVLAARSIELVLAYGKGTGSEEAKSDSGAVSFGRQIETRYFLEGRICYQPIAFLSSQCALTIVTPENKLVCNIPEQLFSRRRKVALWGHGANLQGDPSSFREKFKRVMARRADWWFGYTDLSVPLIRLSGFPAERITVLNNSVDTKEMARQFASIDESEKKVFFERLGLSGGCVGIFLGSLYSEKRINFLLDAADRIRSRVPNFEFLIVGGGADRMMVESFASSRPWVRYLGVLKGREKVVALSSAHLMLNPGLVGLGILDSFVCEVPMITTDCGLHSPEIAYLQNGVNGWMTQDSSEEFVDLAVRLLGGADQLDALVQGCRESAARYTVENMAANFADGVDRCLRTPGYRWAE